MRMSVFAASLAAFLVGCSGAPDMFDNSVFAVSQMPEAVDEACKPQDILFERTEYTRNIAQDIGPWHVYRIDGILHFSMPLGQVIPTWQNPPLLNSYEQRIREQRGSNVLEIQNIDHSYLIDQTFADGFAGSHIETTSSIFVCRPDTSCSTPEPIPPCTKSYALKAKHLSDKFQLNYNSNFN